MVHRVSDPATRQKWLSGQSLVQAAGTGRPRLYREIMPWEKETLPATDILFRDGRWRAVNSGGRHISSAPQ